MPNEPYIEVKLSELMKKKNIKTIEEMKEKTGLSRKAISFALNKKSHRMKTDTIAKFCKALDCEVGELLVYKEGEE